MVQHGLQVGWGGGVGGGLVGGTEVETRETADIGVGATRRRVV